MTPDGSILWQKGIVFSGIANMRALIATDDGGLLVAFVSECCRRATDVALVRMDGDGNLLWSRAYGGPGVDSPQAIAQLADGGFLVTGAHSESTGGGLGASVIRLDAAGHPVWQRALWSTGLTVMRGVLPRPDGGLLAVASFWGAPGIGLVSMSPSGDIEWIVGDGPSDEYGIALLELPGGEHAIVGDFGQSGSSYSDYGVLHVDALGVPVDSCQPGNPTYEVRTDPVVEVDNPVTVQAALLVATPATFLISAASPLDIVLPCAPPPLGEVMGVRVTCGGAGVGLSWQPLVDADTYEVLRGSLPPRMTFAYDHSAMGACGLAVTNWTDVGGCSDGRDSYYLVAGRNAAGRGPLGTSSVGTAIPPPVTECP